ncbi:hypothetical protein FACS1894152_3740 [Bacilli bacterium]|nr:hypothetical protein FACS1894152_3740 [Bacilli bacterium]
MEINKVLEEVVGVLAEAEVEEVVVTQNFAVNADTAIAVGQMADIHLLVVSKTAVYY